MAYIFVKKNSKVTSSQDSHLHPLHLDPPRVGGVVEGALHDVADGLSLGQDLGQVLGAQHVAQGGGGQQAGGVAAHRVGFFFL